MRADICEPDDQASVARFWAVLEELGAVARDQAWGAGVDLWIVMIAGHEVRIYEDAWSLDIEGPDDVVAAILQRMRES